MTNFSENDNLFDAQDEIITNIIDDEESTIFSNPTEHTKKSNTPKKKRRWLVVLSSLLAVAILVGGTFAVIKFIPEKEDPNNLTSTSSGSSSGSSMGKIEVLSIKRDNLDKITVTNGNGNFNFYSEKTNAGSGESASSTTSWYLEGYEKNVTSSSTISSKIGSVISINATREITKLTEAECGLDKPVVTVNISETNNKTTTVYLGNESADKNGCYLKLSDSDKIYLVSSDIKSDMNFTALDLADTSSMPAIETDDPEYRDSESGLLTFDSLEISGKNFEQPLHIIPNNENEISSFAQFIITSPQKRAANNVDKVFQLFNYGLAVSGAYTFDVSANSLAATGLDNPDIVVTMKIKDNSLTYKFKLQEDGYYAAICDGSTVIKKVDAASLEFKDFTSTDFYGTSICLHAIDDLKRFTFRKGDKSYVFDIEKNPDEESDEKYIITIEGKTVKSLTFQNFYQECVGLTAADFNVKNIDGQPDFSIIYTFKDDIGGEQVYDFIKSDATRYEYKHNSISLGRVNSSALNQLAKTLESVYASIE